MADGDWVKLGSTTLDTSGDTLEVDSLDAKQFLYITVELVPSGTIDTDLTINGVTSGYALRSNDNFGTEATVVNQSNIATGSETTASLFIIDIENFDGKEKLFMFRKITGGAGTGGTNYPTIMEGFGKCTATDQISKITLTNTGAGSFDELSNMTVFGCS